MTHPPSGPDNPPPPPGPKDRPRNIREAAEEIGMGYTWLRDKVKARAVPFKQFGRSVRFFDADIAAIKEQAQETPRVSVPRIARGRRVA